MDVPGIFLGFSIDELNSTTSPIYRIEAPTSGSFLSFTTILVRLVRENSEVIRISPDISVPRPRLRAPLDILGAVCSDLGAQ